MIPCSRTDKAPLVPGFGRDATAEQLAPFSDPEQVRDWWSGRFKRAHVGILTGRSTTGGRGLVVIDLDVRKAGVDLPAGYEYAHSGADVLEHLAAEDGAPWPDTYTVLTPSGGIHLYYMQPVDGPLIGCATGAGTTAPHLGPLIDVRGIGGYVIAAGSYSAAQGIAYRRVSDPAMLPQPLPGWLLARLRPAAAPAAPSPRPAAVRVLPTSTRAERYAVAALEGAAADLAALREGDDRRDKTFAAAARLAELSSTAPHILTAAAVHEQLLAAALACGIKGGARQAEKCIRNGWQRGLGLAGRGAGAA